MATRTKARNGEGSIRPRPLKDGTIVYDVQLPNDNPKNPGGKGPFKGGFRTEKEAIAWRRKAFQDIDAGKAVRAKPITVPEVVDQWMKRCSNGKAPTTLKTYDRAQRVHIRRALNIRAGNLDEVRLDAFFKDVMSRAAGTPYGKDGISSAENAHTVLAAAFKWAARPKIGLVTENPLDGYKFNPGAMKRQVQYIPPQDVDRIIAAAGDHLSGLIWQFLLETGARKCEALGLNVGDIDFLRRRVDIDKIASPESNGRQLSPRTKGKAVRWIPLSRPLIAKLAEHVKGRRRDEPLFVGPRGGRLVFVTYERWWYKDLKAAGFKTGDYTPHQLRHTFATLALRDSRLPVIVVSQILGHSSPSVTLAVYAHVMDDQAYAAVDAVVSEYADAVANFAANFSKTQPSIPALERIS